jgi:hypothetical protein
MEDHNLQSGKVSIAEMVFVGMFVLLLGVAAFESCRSSHSGITITQADFDNAAYKAATEEVIPKVLKAPATAKFGKKSDTFIIHSHGIYKVNGYVDSQNSFGALLRSQYVCYFEIAHTNGGFNFKLIHIKMWQGDDIIIDVGN